MAFKLYNNNIIIKKTAIYIYASIVSVFSLFGDFVTEVVILYPSPFPPLPLPLLSFVFCR